MVVHTFKASLYCAVFWKMIAVIIIHSMSHILREAMWPSCQCCSSHQQCCKIFIYESSMPKDMTCARMRKYIELRDKL